ISSAEREHFERVCAQFDIDGYLLTGPPPYELVARAEAATLLLDIGGHLTRPELKRGARVKVYLDDDPGYTQLWHRDGPLPERVEDSFEIALDIVDSDSADADLLRAHGWRVVDPAAVAGTTDTFRRYVQESGAEFSAAQGIYVETCCGWFSDRTTRFLASGK